MAITPRRPLPHNPPGFVDGGAIFFLTVCSAERNRNQLAIDSTWSVLQSAASHYHAMGRWQVRLLLAMPDHAHALVSFPREESIKQVVAAWKHYVARQSGVVWQRDFFDRRLRTEESLQEKSAYIRDNPVRAGLCVERGQWPYGWCPPDVVATPVE